MIQGDKCEKGPLRKGEYVFARWGKQEQRGSGKRGRSRAGGRLEPGRKGICDCPVRG